MLTVEVLTVLRLLIKTENAKIMNNLGCEYYEGDDIFKDYKEAFNYYKKAANQGNSASMFNLGLAYYYGEGVLIDYTQAKYYIKKLLLLEI